MEIDTTTVRLLQSVLSSPSTRRLFTTIADSRIADEDNLPHELPLEERKHTLQELKMADLIGRGKQNRFYVTAKGLKVARDLGKL